VASREHEVFFACVLDLGASELRVDDLVADGDVDRHPVSVVSDAAGADSDHFPFLRLFRRGFGYDRPTGGSLLCFALTDDNPIFEWLDGGRQIGPSPFAGFSRR